MGECGERINPKATGFTSRVSSLLSLWRAQKRLRLSRSPRYRSRSGSDCVRAARRFPNMTVHANMQMTLRSSTVTCRHAGEWRAEGGGVESSAKRGVGRGAGNRAAMHCVCAPPQRLSARAPASHLSSEAHTCTAQRGKHGTEHTARSTRHAAHGTEHAQGSVIGTCVEEQTSAVWVVRACAQEASGAWCEMPMFTYGP